MKRISRFRFVSLIFAIALVFSCAPLNAMASEEGTWHEINVEDIDLDSFDTISTQQYVPKLRAYYLASGTTALQVGTGRNLSLYGVTKGNVAANLRLMFSLEKIEADNSYWTYQSWTYSANNVKMLEKAISVSVPPGRYRLVGKHSAANGSASDVYMTMTQPVTIK